MTGPTQRPHYSVDVTMAVPEPY